MKDGEQDYRMGQIIAKTWSDEQFRRRLLADPAAVLKAEGVQVPAGVAFRVLEDTEKVFHLVLPVQPTTGHELSDEDLVTVAGGLGSVDAMPADVDPVFDGRKFPTGKSQYS